ncbi:hypothetical protein niasHT_017801 [Heterodera trifolii]|uniref:Uncharacterized protein n=1 Tax=Heterodera trifolii TaxID=157864 RepID=A0ABD2L2U6_9BILA
MSAHFRAQLKLAYTDSQEFLTDQESFPVPQQNGQPDILYTKSIRSQLQSLDDHNSDVKSALTQLEDNSDRWMTLRTNMTGAERTQDNPLYDTFVLETPFPKAISDLKKYLRTLRTERRALEAALPVANVQNASAPSLVHLPKTALPTFAGDCTNYTSFWNTFKAGVHDLNIPNSLKFTYLKQCLSGPPLTLINSLPISDDSYDSAVSLLSQHYENPEEVARALHNSLRKLPRIRTGDYFCEDLRALLDQLECICIQMSSKIIHMIL